MRLLAYFARVMQVSLFYTVSLFCIYDLFCIFESLQTLRVYLVCNRM